MSAEAFSIRLPVEVGAISERIIRGDFRFTRYREKLISKGAGKEPRVLSIPTARDRLILKVMSDFLFELFPEARPQLPQEKIARVCSLVNEGGFTSYIKIDLKGFFPSIDHKRLSTKVRKRIRLKAFHELMGQALKNPTVPAGGSGGVLPKCGVAQGLSISNVLAEIFMLEIDREIQALAPAYSRFVDDIIILTNDDPEMLLKQVISILKKSKLKPHEVSADNSKTKFGHLVEGFDFLGYVIHPNKVSVRQSSIKAFEGALVSVFAEYKYRLRLAKSDIEKSWVETRFRWALNLKLTGCIYKSQRFGWIFYYSQITDSSVLRRIDNTVSHLFNRFKISLPPKPKRLLKSFYESKRVDKSTHRYIPNYDDISMEGRRKFLREVGFDLTGKTESDIFFIFSRMIRRATKSLERDIAHIS